MRLKYPGLIVLTAAYLAAVGLILQRTTEERTDDRITIRLSQWQLEGTVRDAIDAIIARYEELNPHIRVEHIAVPDSVYLPWVQTQLVGGTAPDLVEYVWVWPNIPRFFQPIDDAVVEPNPYNRGTPLEGVPWRDTNIDGMTNPDSYVRAHNRHYGITITSHVPRLVYNRDLLRRITGGEEPPATYREFRELCGRVEAYAREHGLDLVPLATSKDSYPFLMFSIMGHATNRLAERLDWRRRLRVTDTEAALDYLRGEWDYTAPEIMAGLKQLREFGEVSTPGFLQRNRDSALTDFVNERALMAVVPSWDASSLRQMAPFALGAFRYPYPREDDPAYGPYTYGPFSEGQVQTGMAFYVNRRTKHRAQALDFLRFLTSIEGSRMFTEMSHWQPATVGVEPSDFAAQFAQVTEGIVWGASFMTLSGADADMFLRGRLNLLWNANGSAAAFSAAVESGLAERLRSDLGREEKAGRLNLCREDAIAAATYMLAPERPALVTLTSVPNEQRVHQLQWVLTQEDAR